MAHFLIPDQCWAEHYYAPISSRLDAFRQEYPPGKVKDDFLEMFREEMDMFRKYKGYYGYVFFIARNS